jgi:outer membrane protein
MRIILLAIVLLVAIHVHAQTSKGSFLIGGSMNLQRTSTNFYDHPGFTLVPSTPSGAFTVSPTVGYFPINNLLIGVQPSYTYNWVLNHPTFKTNSWSVGPLVRYYFHMSKFAVFPEVAMTFDRSRVITAYDVHSNNDITAERIKMNGKTYRGGVGFAWFVSQQVGIETILALKHTDVGKPSLTKNETSVYLNFGIQFYLSKKQ